MRRLAVSVLRRCGYTVMGACGADEAVALFRGASAGPHLLLTDVIMPSVSGPELADRLTAEQPDLKVLYMSGYSGPSADRHIADADRPTCSPSVQPTTGPRGAPCSRRTGVTHIF